MLEPVLKQAYCFMVVDKGWYGYFVIQNSNNKNTLLLAIWHHEKALVPAIQRGQHSCESHSAQEEGDERDERRNWEEKKKKKSNKIENDLNIAE